MKRADLSKGEGAHYWNSKEARPAPESGYGEIPALPMESMDGLQTGLGANSFNSEDNDCGDTIFSPIYELWDQAISGRFKSYQYMPLAQRGQVRILLATYYLLLTTYYSVARCEYK